MARLVPVGDDAPVLARLVASGRATAPVSSGPIPLPPVLGNTSIDVASELADTRDEERW